VKFRAIKILPLDAKGNLLKFSATFFFSNAPEGSRFIFELLDVTIDDAKAWRELLEGERMINM